MEFHNGWFARFESKMCQIGLLNFWIDFGFSMIAPGVSKNPQKYFTNKSDVLGPYNPAKSEKKSKNDQTTTVILVYTLIRAEPGFDIDITNAHNPFDQETVDFLSRNVPV